MIVFQKNIIIHLTLKVINCLLYKLLCKYIVQVPFLIKEKKFYAIVHWVGWVVSTLLAGATVGSFTGGSLADKFGRTKTFLLDAIPLAVGAFLWSVLLTQILRCSSLIIIRKISALKCNGFLQCHCTEHRDNDNWSLTCWNWNWYIVCYCATLYIWGAYFLIYYVYFLT